MKEIKYIDLFAGVGGIRKGFEQALKEEGYIGKCVMSSEIKASAKKVYKENFGEQEIKGDITEVDEKEIEDFDYLLGGFPCFTGDTLVLTDQGYKPINEIQVGDRVITHNKEYQEVTAVYNQGYKPTKRVEADLFDKIDTTDNHPFYVREVERLSDGRIQHKEPVWKEIKEIEQEAYEGIQNYMGVAINQESKVPNWEGNKLQVPSRNVSQEFCLEVESSGYEEVYKKDLRLEDKGIMYLLGVFMQKGRKLDTNGVIIECATTESVEFEEGVKELKYTRHGYTKTVREGVNRYHFSDTELGLFLKPYQMTGYRDEMPSFVYDLPIDMLEEFIKGFTLGQILEVQDDISRIYKEVQVDGNAGISYGLAQCIMKVYKTPCKVKSTKYPMAGYEHVVYTLRYTTDVVYQAAFYEEGYIWYPIEKIESTGLKEEVWDISVEGCHSFVANNCIVHNCQAFSVAGHRRGFEDTRGTLFFDIARILEEKKPRGFILENVEGLITHQRTAEQKKNGEVGETLRIMLEILEEMGYKVSYKVLEGKDFGVPQRRRRIFLVGDREKEVELKDFTPYKTRYIKDITEEKGYEKECEFNEALQAYLKDKGEDIGYLYGKQIKDVRAGGNNISGWDLGLRGKVTEREKEILDGIRGRRRLKANKETKGAEKKDFAGLFMTEIEDLVGFDPKEEVERLLEIGYLAEKEINGYDTIDLRGSRLSYKYAKILDPEDFSLTIVATDARVNGVVDGGGVRGLTKRELLRLNGFPEDFTMDSVTRNQALDLMGNTVIVPIIKEVGKKLLEVRRV